MFVKCLSSTGAEQSTADRGPPAARAAATRRRCAHGLRRLHGCLRGLAECLRTLCGGHAVAEEVVLVLHLAVVAELTHAVVPGLTCVTLNMKALVRVEMLHKGMGCSAK